MKLGQLIILFTLPILLFPYFSFAQYEQPENINVEIPTKFFSCGPYDNLRRCILKILGDVLRVILVVALAAAAIMFAWAGIGYIVSGGEKQEDRDKMKRRIVYAAAGLVVAFLSWVLTVIIARVVSRGEL